MGYGRLARAIDPVCLAQVLQRHLHAAPIIPALHDGGDLIMSQGEGHDLVLPFLAMAHGLEDAQAVVEAIAQLVAVDVAEVRVDIDVWDRLDTFFDWIACEEGRIGVAAGGTQADVLQVSITV